MTEPNVKLVKCFAAVFPNLSEEQIPDCNMENVSEWDSLATVTLASVLDQEFGTAIDVLDLLELRSFGAAQEYLRERHLIS